jgi:predicted ABC-type ATPase
VTPNVYIIAGPNGAGKTTFAREFLPYYAECKSFVNADLIAQGMSPFSPKTAAVRAGRLMLEEIGNFARRGVDFGFETTLSGRTMFGSISHLRKYGYQVHLFYLWISTVELALDRVKDRVREGGHDVPEATVRRRYDRSVRNFLLNYRNFCESWMLLDNSGDEPRIVATQAENKLSIIAAQEYEDILECYGKK